VWTHCQWDQPAVDGRRVSLVQLQTRFTSGSCVPRLLVLLFGCCAHSSCVHTRSDLPLLMMYRNSNACPDCGRTFKTPRGLAVHRHSCPKRPPRAPYSADYGDIENASQGQYQYEYLDSEGKLILSTKHVVNAVDLCTRLASRARFWAAIHAGRRESRAGRTGHPLRT
jgi:hypothetical protein